MTDSSDYFGWFDAVPLDDLPPVRGAVRWPKTWGRGEGPVIDPDLALLLSELGIDTFGVNPSNLLRTIASTGVVATPHRSPH